MLHHFTGLHHWWVYGSWPARTPGRTSHHNIMSCNSSIALMMKMSFPVSRPAACSPVDEWWPMSDCSDDSRLFSAVNCSTISCCCCCSGWSAFCSTAVSSTSVGDDDVKSQSSTTWCSPASVTIDQLRDAVLVMVRDSFHYYNWQ